jgi:hypothetical protein
MSFKRENVQKCIKCGEGIAQSIFQPNFVRITIEPFILDFPAIQREGGLEQSLGGGQSGAVLTTIMGPNPDLAHTLPVPNSFLVCGDCAYIGIPEDDDKFEDSIEQLLNLARKRAPKKEAKKG